MWRCKRPECDCEGHQRKCADGDQSAARELVRTLTPMVDEAVRTILRHSQPEDWDDVRQDTFRLVFKKFRTWRGECPFCLWVRQIAIRAAYSQSRLDQRLKRIRPAPDDPDQLVDRKPRPLPPQVWKCIDRTLGQFPDDLRRAYDLHVKQGMTIKETAKTAGTGERTIYLWLDRIKQRLLACLD